MLLCYSDQNASGQEIAPLCQRGDTDPEGSTTKTSISSTSTTLFPTSTTMLPMSTTHAITTTTSSEVSECPEGWTHQETSCYWVVLHNADWVEAYNGCPQLHPDAHLASSGSESENEIISSLHSGSPYNFWLGGTDADEEGNWIWTDGTPFNYTYWASGQGEGGITENCIAIYTYNQYGTWKDYECYDSHPYICEINLDYK